VKGRSTEFGAASRLCHASGWRQAAGQAVCQRAALPQPAYRAEFAGAGVGSV